MIKPNLRPKLGLSALIAFLSLYSSLVLNYAFFAKVVELRPFNDTGADIFLYTMPVVLFFLSNFVFHVIALPFVHKVLIPLILVISAAVSYQEIFFNIYFNKSMLNNVLQTTAAESARLITPGYVLWIVCLGVLPALAYIAVKVKYRVWYKELLTRLVLAAVSFLCALGIAMLQYQDYASFFRNNKSVTHLIVPSNFIGAGVSKYKDWKRSNIPYTQLDMAVVQNRPAGSLRRFVVLVVGETTRAANWGLNGYSRQTTPLLAARGDEIVNFPQVRSCGTSTAHSLPCMFSTFDRTDYDEIKAEHQDNLLDIVQRAGVEVTWLENDSGCKGVCGKVPNTDVTSLNLPEYCRNGECLDNILLTKFDEALNKNDKDAVLILHTIGSHGPTYYERYTEAERKFTPTCDTNEIDKCARATLVNTYDNTVLYVDQFIDKVIRKLENRDDLESAVYYVSDHGESLGENGMYLHAAPYAIAPSGQTHIPMVMWFSKAFRQHGGIDFQCLKQKAAENEYSHDHYFSTVLGLMDISNSQTYRKEMDILAACRRPR